MTPHDTTPAAAVQAAGPSTAIEASFSTLEKAPRRHRRTLQWDEQEQATLRHTILLPYLYMAPEDLVIALAKGIKRHCGSAAREQSRGIFRNRERKAADDLLRRVVKLASAEDAAETLLAAEYLRHSQPGLFVTTRTFGQQRVRFLVHRSQAERKRCKGQIDRLRVPPVKVGLQLSCIFDRLIAAAEKATGLSTKPEPRKPSPLLPLLAEDEDPYEAYLDFNPIGVCGYRS
jgi:hypothetical protein